MKRIEHRYRLIVIIMAFNRKIIYNDLVGIALSCIVSLLFVHGVCQFVSSSNKKQTTTELHQSGRSEEADVFLSEAAHSLSDQAESNETIVNTFCQPTNDSKVAGYVIYTFTSFLKNDKPWLQEPDNAYPLSLLWNPSIPIAHRKLLI